MGNSLVKVNGTLLKFLYKKLGLSFDYKVGAHMVKTSGLDTSDAEYPKLIGILVEAGYASTSISNTGKFKGREQVYLTRSVKELIAYNSAFSWYKFIYWCGVLPLWVVVPVGTWSLAYGILTLPLFHIELTHDTAMGISYAVSLAYFIVLGLAYLFRSHKT